MKEKGILSKLRVIETRITWGCLDLATRLMIVFLTEIGTQGRESVEDGEFSVGEVEFEVL